LKPASHLRVKGAARITGSAQRLQDVEAPVTPVHRASFFVRTASYCVIAVQGQSSADQVLS